MEILTRVQSKTDQRKVLIRLTEHGNEMQVKAAEIPAKLMKKLNITANETEIAKALELKNQLYDLIHLLKQSEQTTA